MTNHDDSRRQAEARLADAASSGQLSATAAVHIRRWLVEPRYAPYRPLLVDHLLGERFDLLHQVFWTEIPFGTAGRRGRMYPIGTNAINDDTIGASAQGVADYVRSQLPADVQPTAAIGYDTRHRSPEFAQLCAEVLAAADFRVYLLGQPRATPALALAVRHFGCHCGLMISASHNPPEDNAVKVFDASGGQVRPPDDAGMIECVNRVERIERLPLARAKAEGRIVACEAEIDALYVRTVNKLAVPGARDVRILFSPLHGVGLTSVLPVLEADGFAVDVFAPQATPDGDFPNVPNHVANPENPAVFEAPIAWAAQQGHELVIATDPDADRLGAAAPIELHHPGDVAAWRTLDGNQLAVLIAEFLLSRLQYSGRLTPAHYLVKTLVTTDMLARQADHYGIQLAGDVLTGFKWIGAEIERRGAEGFVMGCEEAHGYLVGSYIRDKCGAGAAQVLCEYAAALKTEGLTLHAQLDRLYERYGYHGHRQITRTLPGAEGVAQMHAIVDRLRQSPPAGIGRLSVMQCRDYGRQVVRLADGRQQPLAGPRGELLIFDLERSGYRLAIRPSGTEPKLKVYLYGVEPARDAPAEARRRVDSWFDLVAAEAAQW